MGLRFGIFSDDAVSSHAAAMIANGLSQTGRTAVVVAPEFGHAGDLRCISTDPVRAAALPDRVNAFELQSLLEKPGIRDHDCVVSLPLIALRERGVRIQFDALLAGGRDRPAAERALRTARYDALGADRRDALPVWFLACAGQDDLRTRADLRPERGPPLPFAVRALPTSLPRLAAEKGRALLEGRPAPDEVRGGILLAALVVAVAADPHARRIDAGTLAHLMATRDLHADRETSDLLIDLAGAYERTEETGVDRAGPEWASAARAVRRRSTGHRPVTLAGPQRAAERIPSWHTPARRER